MDLVKIKNTKVSESGKTLYLKVDTDRNVSSNKEHTTLNVVITDTWKQASKFLIRYNKDKDYLKVQFHCSDSDKKKLNLRVNDQLYLSTIKSPQKMPKSFHCKYEVIQMMDGHICLFMTKIYSMPKIRQTSG